MKKPLSEHPPIQPQHGKVEGDTKIAYDAGFNRAIEWAAEIADPWPGSEGFEELKSETGIRACRIEIASKIRSLSGVEPSNTSDGGNERVVAVPLEILTQRSGESRDPLGDGSVKVGPHREDAAGIKPGQSDTPQAQSLREALEDAKKLLTAYDEAMASQSGNMADAKLIVMANYGDLCADALRKIIKRSALTPPHAVAGIEQPHPIWPEGRFSFFDEAGEHDPCYVVMPGGAMLAVNHDNRPGVDIARAKFIIAACNDALDRDVDQASEPTVNAIANVIAPFFEEGCTPFDAAFAVMRRLRATTSLRAPSSASMAPAPAHAVTGDVHEALDLLQLQQRGKAQAFRLMDAHRAVSDPTTLAKADAYEECGNELKAALSVETITREDLARVVCDEMSLGNIQFEDAGERLRSDCLHTADAILSLLNGTGLVQQRACIDGSRVAESDKTKSGGAV